MYALRRKRPNLPILSKLLTSSRVKIFRNGFGSASTDDMGIKGVTKRDVEGTAVGANIAKFRYLLEGTAAKDNTEQLWFTSYGTVRLDNMNLPKYHGQFEEDNENSYLYEGQEVSQQISTSAVEGEEADSVKGEITVELSTDFIQDPVHTVEEKSQNTNAPENVTIAYERMTDSEKNLVDDTCFQVLELSSNAKVLEKGKRHKPGKYKFNFTEEWKVQLRDERRIREEQRKREEQQMWKESPKVVEEEDEDLLNIASGIKLGKDSVLKNFTDFQEELQDLQEEESKRKGLQQIVEEEETELIEQLRKSSDKKEAVKLEEMFESQKFDEMDCSTPYEYYQKIKRGVLKPQTAGLKEKLEADGHRSGADPKNLHIDSVTLDSQGFRSFKEQIIAYDKMTREDIVWMLKKKILFDENDIIAIDKPYGLTCHGDPKQAKGPILHELFPDLCKLLDIKNLHLVHRLDKEVTGVLLLAKTQAMASRLMSMFKRRQIKKHYTLITRGVPDASEGIIDIPMEEGHIEQKERMVLRPHLEEKFRQLSKPSTSAKRAVTRYRVRCSYGNAALIDVDAETGVKHQIRCHFGFGLRTPILGDHKYSYLDKLAPQKLPADMLLKLRVRQSKVRNIPLHLHCRCMEIPELGRDGGILFIKAHLPKFFQDNARSLKLLD